MDSSDKFTPVIRFNDNQPDTFCRTKMPSVAMMNCLTLIVLYTWLTMKIGVIPNVRYLVCDEFRTTPGHFFLEFVTFYPLFLMPQFGAQYIHEDSKSLKVS